MEGLRMNFVMPKFVMLMSLILPTISAQSPVSAPAPSSDGNCFTFLYITVYLFNKFARNTYDTRSKECFCNFILQWLYDDRIVKLIFGYLWI